MFKQIALCVALFGSAAGCTAADAGDEPIADPPAIEGATQIIDGTPLPREPIRRGEIPLATGIDRLPTPDTAAPSNGPQVTDAPACEGFSVGDVLFASGKADLTQAGLAALVHLAELVPSGARVAIDGHTDSVPIDIGNQRLSEMRATEVANALGATVGDDVTFVRVQGWGETRPIADNSTSEGRSLNRRVEIYVNC